MKSLNRVILIWLVSVACYAEEACVPAVDLADSLNVNAKQSCDYKQSGLNRIVHNLFGRDSSSGSSSSARVNAAATAGLASQISPPFSTAGELAEGRYILLRNIGLKCPQGFRLVDEQYLPSPEHLRLNIFYKCL